jgi:hypothetical protein
MLTVVRLQDGREIFHNENTFYTLFVMTDHAKRLWHTLKKDFRQQQYKNPGEAYA